MSGISRLRSASGSGFIRTLKSSEQHLLREHLLRLDPTSRRDRFNGGIGDEFLHRYAARCFEDGTVVTAYLQDGVVRGAAELHAPDHAPDAVPEIAFSVENCVRRQGVGSALFEQLLVEARRRNYKTLRITTGDQNHAMKALALKFGANLSFRRGETTGIVDLIRLPDGLNDIATADRPVPPTVPSPPWTIAARDVARGHRAVWGTAMRFYLDLFTGRHWAGTR